MKKVVLIPVIIIFCFTFMLRDSISDPERGEETGNPGYESENVASGETSKLRTPNSELPTPKRSEKNVGKYSLDMIINGVEAHYKEVQGIRAKFTQRVTFKSLSYDRYQEGVVSLRRPDKMRWDYKSPEGQVLLFDGKVLWMYFPSRNEVIREDLEIDMLRLTPLSLLLGMGDIRDDFHISLVTDRETGNPGWETENRRNGETEKRRNSELRTSNGDRTERSEETSKPHRETLNRRNGETAQLQNAETGKRPPLADSPTRRFSHSRVADRFLKLVPKNPIPQAAEIIVGIKSDGFQITELIIIDYLKNINHISFEDIEEGVELLEVIFQFKVPEGVVVRKKEG